MTMSILEIVNKADLMDKIAFMREKDIFGNETLIHVLMYYYVFGELKISDMSSEEIYHECLKIACNQIAKGAIRSKWYIAEQLMNGNNEYLMPDKALANLLINLASYENEPEACEVFERNALKIKRKDLANFWKNKGKDGCLDKIGISLNLIFNEERKAIELLN